MANPLRTAGLLARTNGLLLPGQKSIRPADMLPPAKSGKAQQVKWSFEAAVRDGFKGNVWVYAATDRIMKSAASIPWTVHVRGDEPDAGGVPPWVPAEAGHPLQQLLDRPNPWHGRAELMQRMIAHLVLGGNALTSMVRARVRQGDGRLRDVPVELWNVPIKGVAPVPTRTEHISHYTLPRGSTPDRLPAEDVIHLQYPDPDNPYWGLSPLKAAARSIDTDNEAVQWNRVSMTNRAVPDGVFSFTQPLNRSQWEEARAQVREQYAGVRNARTPWVLGSGAEWHPMSQTAVELDFIRSRHMNREEIAAAIGVPLPLIGVYEDATLANLEASRRILWEDTVIPLLEALRDALNHRLVPFFGPQDELWVDFDTTGVEVLQEKLSEKLEQAKALFAMGVPVALINERLDLALSEYPGWDVSLVPANMAPLAALLGLSAEDAGAAAGALAAAAEEEA